MHDHAMSSHLHQLLMNDANERVRQAGASYSMACAIARAARTNHDKLKKLKYVHVHVLQYLRMCSEKDVL